MFDPYHKWLGISPKDQPPNHYRLLGIDLFETDSDVIDTAANKQMAYIQGCATGPHLALSQKLLNEIAAARLCLLTPAKKEAYDESLKSTLASVPLATSQLAETPSSLNTSKTIGTPPVSSPTDMSPTGASSQSDIVIQDLSGTGVNRRTRRNKRPNYFLIGTVAISFSIVATVLLLTVGRSLFIADADKSNTQKDARQLASLGDTLPIAEATKSQTKEKELGTPTTSTLSRTEDAALLQGTWHLIDKKGVGGRELPKSDPRWHQVLEVEGTVFRLTVMGGSPAEGTFQLGSNDVPKSFDFYGKGPKGFEIEWHGIYELSENSFRLSFLQNGKGNAFSRLRAFDGPDSGDYFVFKRSSVPNASQSGQEWLQLFNGVDMDGWTTSSNVPANSWVVRDGELMNHAKGESLFSEKEFVDMELTLDFSLPEGCNSGVFLRGRYEVQLLDTKAEQDARNKLGDKFHPASVCGSLSRQMAPSKNTYLGADKWNSLRVILVGNRVTVFMNGTQLLTGELNGPTQGGMFSTDGTKGPIMFQNHYEVSGPRFKNIRVRPIE